MRSRAFLCLGALVSAALSSCLVERELAFVSVCSNSICEPTEDPDNCSIDCPRFMCGNNICEVGEYGENCPEDCSDFVCGDGRCDEWESPYTCPEDCTMEGCGNGLCEPGEIVLCPGDCEGRQCGNGVCEHYETVLQCPVDCPIIRKVDLLFVMDDSYSMYNEQTSVMQAFMFMYDALRSDVGEADLHVGLVTTDLGTGSYSSITYCLEPGGDKGRLGLVKGVDLGASCLGPGQRYIIDSEPAGCTIERLSSGTCTDHACDQSNCGHEPDTTMVLDESTGCPRCRNFTGSSQDAFACLASVGVSGCGFEQPLEAAYQALADNPYNHGFLREDALLGLIMVTDEDDCSASEPDAIFNPDQGMNRIDSELGFLHSFRCFEFGVVCDVNGRSIGPRKGCKPMEEGGLLHNIDRYVGLLRSLKEPGQLLVAALAGPTDGNVDVILNTQGQPELRPTCYDPYAPDQGAAPAVRLKDFTSRFNDAEAMESFAFISICQGDFTETLQGIGDQLRLKLGYDVRP